MDSVLLKAFWGTNNRKAMTSLFAFIAAFCGAVAGVPPAWTAIGLPVPASKEYVRQVIEPVKAAQIDSHTTLTKAVNRLYRSQLELYKSQLTEALFRAEHDPAATTSGTVQEHIHDLQDKLNEATSKLNAQHND